MTENSEAKIKLEYGGFLISGVVFTREEKQNRIGIRRKVYSEMGFIAPHNEYLVARPVKILAFKTHFLEDAEEGRVAFVKEKDDLADLSMSRNIINLNNQSDNVSR